MGKANFQLQALMSGTMRENPYGKHLEKYALRPLDYRPQDHRRGAARAVGADDLGRVSRKDTTHVVPLGPYIGSYRPGFRKWYLQPRRLHKWIERCKPEVRVEWEHAIKRTNAIKAALQAALQRCPPEATVEAIGDFIRKPKGDSDYEQYLSYYTMGFLGQPCPSRSGPDIDDWNYGADDVFEVALLLWALTQLVGFPSQSLISALQAEPRRALSFCTPVMDNLTRLLPDAATRFASALFSTWSVQKAIRTAEPQIPGFSEGDLTKLDFPEARKIIDGDPNWRKRYHGSVFVREKELRQLPLDTVRKLLRDDKIDLYREMCIYIPKISATLAETVEGRRLIRAKNLNDVQAMLKAHDTVYLPALRADAEKQEAKGQVKRETWHAKAAKLYKFPSGVRPLVTRADFLSEHADLEHCIDTYWYNTTSHCFSFTAPDGTRATLELRRKFGDKSTNRAEVVQFYGQNNRPASPACRQLLAQFIAMNSFDYSRDS